MVAHLERLQIHLRNNTRCTAHSFRCCRRISSIFLTLLTAAFMVQIGSLVLGLNEFTAASNSHDHTIQADAQHKAVKTMTRLDLNDDERTTFHFLTLIIKQIYAGWLQGRTTGSKAYFDDHYISTSRQIHSQMNRMEAGIWRQLQNLSRAVRIKIDAIQNPPNCDEAKLLVYDTTWQACGFGCHLHDIIVHFISSIYANRTFVLQSAGWNYHKRGWEHSLLPFGKCKYTSNALDLPLLSDKTKHERVVRTENTAFDYLDWSVPVSILSKLEKIHPDPYAWWVGQLVAYAFRLQPHIINHIQRIGNEIGFTEKVVGIHVRWGDKTFFNESIKHEVDEYMDFVETWFRRQELEGESVERVVFVATENSEVWVDLKTRYPAYHFIGSGYVNETRDLEPTKKNFYQGRKHALESVLTDLHFLSKCDYVVCTFSSQICTVTYELMMKEKADAYYRLQSLDLTYVLYGAPRYIATQSHVQVNERQMSMEVGDLIIGIDKYFSRRIDGFYPAINTRTRCQGDVPANKLEVFVIPSPTNVFDDL